jgi:hypothetical protein
MGGADVGVDVLLQDESGKEVAFIGDPKNLIVRTLPDSNDARFAWANTIDCYGDTTFNHLQAKLLRKEWSILIQNAANQETKMLLQEVDELLQRCISGVGLYVKFIGD